MIDHFEKIQPKIGAIDTEADGLHITLSKPFMFQWGYLHPTEKIGYTYAIDMEKYPLLSKQLINHWLHMSEKLKILLGHNIKFDLHMLANAGFEYKTENLSDTMFYIRYAHDALTMAHGGPPLKLKDYTTRYIDHTAKHHEKLLKRERTAITSDLNLKLKQRLPHITLGEMKEYFKDPIFQLSDLPENLREPYLDWLQLDVPIYLQPKITGLVEPSMISYATLNRKNITEYAHKDIVYTLEVFLQTDPVITARDTRVGLEIENSLIFPLFEMERVGFKADKKYLEDCQARLRNYIIRRRADLHDLLGQTIKVGQHAKIKEILRGDYNLEILSTGAEQLNLIVEKLKQSEHPSDAVDVIETIQELRTLEKWYSAYIIRFLKDLRDTDRLYTTINQVGTVSGRVTSDFQQFPKHPITDIDGNELFYPRKMIQVTGGDYNAITYLDYSQIELRLQAMYTILVDDPDLNMCRAYMPYLCHSDSGEPFVYTDPLSVSRWSARWYLDEDPTTVWTPTDLHSATTVAATGVDPLDPEFADLRSTIGKKVNFAKNYGAQRKKIRALFPFQTEDEITRINDAYYLTFPGVKTYHQYCYGRASFPYTSNLFGIKYYNVSGHKLINLLVQGSAAYLLKIQIRKLYDYTKANNIKSRWQMQIHDELSWERHKDETEVFLKFKEIMEDYPDTLIPIVAELEVTTTTWAEKKGAHSIEDLRLHLSS